MDWKQIYSYTFCPLSLLMGGIEKESSTSFLESIAIKIFDFEKKNGFCLNRDGLRVLFNKTFWKKNEKNKESKKLASRTYCGIYQWHDWYTTNIYTYVEQYVPFKLDTICADYFIAPVLLLGKQEIIVLTFNEDITNSKRLTRDLYTRLLAISIQKVLYKNVRVINFMVDGKELKITRAFFNEETTDQTEKVISAIINNIVQKKVWPNSSNCGKCKFNNKCLFIG